MFAGRGVALGLGRLNLTDLAATKRSTSICTTTAAAAHRRRNPAAGSGSGSGRRRRSEGARISTISNTLPAPVVALPAGGSYYQHLPQFPPENRSIMESQKKISTTSRGGGLQKQPSQKTPPKKRVVIKKPFDRGAFWAACRAIVLGTLLLAGGAAMCTLGYYKDQFAAESWPVLPVDGGVVENTTMVVVNPTKRLQFHSMSFIGPVVMGAGAFVLMMACVTTLESRDRRARIYQQQVDQQTMIVDETTERTPLSRQGTATAKSAVPPPAPRPPGPGLLKSPSGNIKAVGGDAKPAPAAVESGVAAAKKKEEKEKGSKYEPADLVAVSPALGRGANKVVEATTAGVVNRSFTRDDSKSASKPDTDSGPSGTTTTTLTWSKNGGPVRCEPVDPVVLPTSGGNGNGNKLPSSASCIAAPADTAAGSVGPAGRRPPDERALLQRFLEDQSRLVEDRLNRRMQLRTAAGGHQDQAQQTEPLVMNVVAAEVHHHAGDASPSPSCVPSSRVPEEGPPPTLIRAPVITLDTLESYSPFPATSDDSTDHYRSPIIATDEDLINGNIGHLVYQTPPPAVIVWDPSPSASVPPSGIGDPKADRKLYDSVFLAEKLRTTTTTGQDQGNNNKGGGALPPGHTARCPNTMIYGTIAGRTGDLCMDVNNANY